MPNFSGPKAIPWYKRPFITMPEPIPPHLDCHQVITVCTSSKDMLCQGNTAVIGNINRQVISLIGSNLTVNYANQVDGPENNPVLRIHQLALTPMP
jgi:hypothetical protein